MEVSCCGHQTPRLKQFWAYGLYLTDRTVDIDRGNSEREREQRAAGWTWTWAAALRAPPCPFLKKTATTRGSLLAVSLQYLLIYRADAGQKLLFLARGQAEACSSVRAPVRQQSYQRHTEHGEGRLQALRELTYKACSKLELKKFGVLHTQPRGAQSS